MLQVVVGTRFGQEYMNQHFAVVHGYPFGISQAVYGKGSGVGPQTSLVAHALHDGRHLTGRVPLADDEVLADGIADFREVGYNDFISYLFFYALNELFKQGEEFADFAFFLGKMKKNREIACGIKNSSYLCKRKREQT